MFTQQNNPLSEFTLNWVRLLSGLAIAVGLAVLCGWIFDISALKSVLPGLVSMKANPALGLLLSALVLFSQTFQITTGVIPWFRRASIVLVLLIGLITFAEYRYAWDAGIDQLLFHEPPNTILTSHPGRMSVLTAGCLVLLGAALLLTELNCAWFISQYLAVFTGFMVLLPILGYLQGDIAFFPDTTSQIAVHAALGFLSLSVGIFVFALAMEASVQLRNDSSAKESQLFSFTESRIAIAVVWTWHLFFPASKRGGIRHYLLTLVLMGLALWIRMSIAPVNAGLQYVAFFPPITLAAIAGGYRTGLFATLIGVAFATIIFTPPYYSLSWANLEASFWPNLVFLMDGTIVSISIEAMHRYRQRYERELWAAKKSDAHELALNKELNGHIVEIKQTTQALQGSESRLRALFNTTAIAIVVIDEQGIIKEFNPASETIFGYSKAEMIGQKVNRLMPEPCCSEHDGYLKSYLASRQKKILGKSREVIGKRKGEETFPMELSVDEAILGDHQIFVGFVKDISERKQLEAEFVMAKQAAEAANRSKSEFLANMSHEIRTPMNAIIGLTRLVMETELLPKQQDYLGKIQSSSQVLLGILNDILDLSKIESGRLEIEQMEFDPTLMLQSVSDLFIAKIEEKDLEIFLEVAPEIPLTVKGDPLRIQQVLSNLVSNAIKFTPKGEIHITMGLEASSGEDLLLRLNVRDTGIGISETIIPHLFQSFSQADASITRKFGGSGLGLVISKQLVELMGGSISVSSKLGQGSTFSFTIHCGKGQSYNWNQDSHCLKHTRVLVVDDQQTSCDILTSILESWHLQVETALSAEAALEKLQAVEQTDASFDLLLLDWKLEGMSGLALVHELEQKESIGELKHHLTVIMVTAYSKEQLLEEASSLAIHLETVLTKPVVPSSLLNTILHVYHHQGMGNHQHSKPQINPYEAARPLRNARLLLVEDNELNQQVASEFLEKAGLRVSIANHGGEAVQWLQKKEFDVVLMDLQMPEMDGYEATRRIRELPECQNLPIIAMTAAAMQNDREACLAAGMNDHVAKPIQPMELINALLRWVDLPGFKNLEGLTVDSAREETGLNLANKLPGFDLQNVLTMLANDEEKLVRMLQSFREQFIIEEPLIAAKITAGDLDAAEKQLHTLKGAAGNLGAKELYEACAKLDAELITGLYNSTTLANWLKAFDKTMDSINSLQSAQTSVTSLSVDNSALLPLIDKLDTLLANDDFISDELLLQLKKLLPNEQQQTNYDLLSQFIMDTDYGNARVILNTFK